MKKTILGILFVLSSHLGWSTQETQNFKRVLKLMGSRFEITVVAQDSVEANRFIEAAVQEISRIEKLISSWDPHSQTSQINANAGKQPVVVDAELFQLIERSLKISELTQGAFDISFASMDRIWKFDGSMTRMPTREEINASVANVGYHNIILDPSKESVFLKLPGMKIGFGAIGKGYAADKAKALLQGMGVAGGIINASGDLTTWGKQSDGSDWMVAITNPLDKEHVFSWMPVVNSAVVTSGNYEKYVEFDGVRYTHIIDPRTGYPSTGMRSVTIFTKTAEFADALSTSVFVMGLETGMDFINQLKGVECIIVTEDNKIHTSKNIKIENN